MADAGPVIGDINQFNEQIMQLELKLAKVRENAKIALANAKAQGWQQAIDALQDEEQLVNWLDAKGYDANDPANWMGSFVLRMLADYLDSTAKDKDWHQ